eukprot:scaffold982_cov139-Cylindrotheca_fusiformis.AAC.1
MDVPSQMPRTVELLILVAEDFCRIEAATTRHRKPFYLLCAAVPAHVTSNIAILVDSLATTMGELHVAKIKSLFERGGVQGGVQGGEVIVNTDNASNTQSSERIRTPNAGSAGGSKKKLGQDRRHRKVKLATINCDNDETDECFASEPMRCALSEGRHGAQRRSLPPSGIASSPLRREREQEQSAKDWRNLKNDLGLSPGTLAERREVFNRRRNLPTAFEKGREASSSPREPGGDQKIVSVKQWRNLKGNLGLSPGSLARRPESFDRGPKAPVEGNDTRVTGRKKDLRRSSTSPEPLAGSSNLVETANSSEVENPMNSLAARRVSLNDMPDLDNKIRTDNRRAMSRSPPRDTRSQDCESRTTVSKEMEALKSLGNRAQVTSLIQQFSLQPTPKIRGSRKFPVKDTKQEESSRKMPSSVPIEVNPPPAPDAAGEIDAGDLMEEETLGSEDSSETDSQSETDTADYSYDEVTATEVDDDGEGENTEYLEEEVTATEVDEHLEGENTEYLEESSVDMDESEGSYDLHSSPESSHPKVVLDFEGMEKPPIQVEEQHVKVVADIEALMSSTRNYPEVEKQDTIKERMLQGLLAASKKWGSGSDDIHEKLQDADLTVDEVSAIVAHINMCEHTKSPVRWDLIKDIVYPDGIDEDPEEKESKVPARKEAQSEIGESLKPIPRVSLTSSMKVNSDRSQVKKHYQPQELGKVAAEEIFRNQYNLSADEMGDIMAHLTLCEETGTQIRWDLIHRIIYPDDDVSTQHSNAGAITDPGSTMIDIFNDNESKASWFSIYPEFDECASEVTFIFDAARSQMDADLESTKQSAGLNAVGKLLPGSVSEDSGLAARNDELLLRKRVRALKASRHSSLILDRKKKSMRSLG